MLRRFFSLIARREIERLERRLESTVAFATDCSTRRTLAEGRLRAVISLATGGALTDVEHSTASIEAAIQRHHIAIRSDEYRHILAGKRLSRSVNDVLDERADQRLRFPADHDDAHDRGQLADAAACYATNAGLDDEDRDFWPDVPLAGWPWPHEYWRPSTRRRDLVKAGALILAEIERLDRIEAEAEATRAAEVGIVNVHAFTPAGERLAFWRGLFRKHITGDRT